MRPTQDLPVNDRLAETRAAYDTVAEDYADLLRDELAGRPLDRHLLAVFAEQIQAGPGGPVADVGCGPGRITGHLAGLGLKASGLDLSPGMIRVARRQHPALGFAVGTLASLPYAAASHGGVISWYSLIHTPPEGLTSILTEIARVVRPGGSVLLAFQTGEDEHLHRTLAYGHQVELHSYRHSLDRMTGLLRLAGLTVEVTVLREPEQPHETTRQAYLMARR